MVATKRKVPAPTAVSAADHGDSSASASSVTAQAMPLPSGVAIEKRSTGRSNGLRSDVE